MEIQTGRCIIRDFEERDMEPFMAYRNDMDWMRYQGFKGLTKQEYMNVLLGESSLEKGVQLAISHKESDTLIGDLYLKREGDMCWVGYSICREKARQGYGYEAVTAVIGFLREQGVCCFKAGVERGNLASVGLLKKMGFSFEGAVDGEEIFTLEF